MSNVKEFKLGELFCGPGGLALGAISACIEDSEYRIIHKWANDYDASTCDTYRRNICPDDVDSVICGDVRKLDIDSLGDIDALAFGFPCNDFSVVGEQKGFDGVFGPLYSYGVKVLKKYKPLWFLAENVGGLRSANEGKAFEQIKKDLIEAGYRIYPNLYKFEEYGVPQARHRMIIVGIRNDLKKAMKYPSETNGNNSEHPWLTAKEAIDDLWDKIDNTNIKNHTSKDYSKAKFYPGRNMQGNCRIKADKPSPTIRSEHHGNIEGHYRTMMPDKPFDTNGWRRLSVRECARLQSFPDSFEFPVSSSDAYKQIGNAVPPILAWHIARALYISLFT